MFRWVIFLIFVIILNIKKNCSNSFPVLFHCADGLYFDRELKTCNFPEYAECPLEVCPRTNDPDNIVFLPSDAHCDK